jgi:hypothetical protein
MTKNYFLDPNKLPKQKRNIVLLYAVTGIVALLIIFVIQRLSGNTDPAWLAIVAIPVLLVLVAARSIHQRTELWENYILTLEDGVFIQNQPHYPETRIPLSSITGTETTKEGLYLKSKQGTRIFGIPVQLRDEEYAELSQIVADYLAKKDLRAVVIDEIEIELDDAQPAPESVDGVSAVISEAEGIDEVPGDDLKE